MANPAAVPSSLYFLGKRNAEAAAVIGDYASNHAMMDIIIGAVTGFVPAGGLIGMATSIAVQAPLVYQPMVRRLALIYSRGPDKYTTSAVAMATGIGAIGEIGSEAMSEYLSQYLSTEFGQQFMVEILTDLIPELGAGAAASLIPVVSIFASAAVDAILAATLTWQVGTMVTVYFMNGDQWLGSKENTHAKIKGIVGISPKQKDRVDLDTLASKIPELRNAAVPGICQQISAMRAVKPDITKEEIRQIFKTNYGFPDVYIDEALKRSGFK